jgi:stearoyl-CoA desaturase (delta-9 desaturase)
VRGFLHAHLSWLFSAGNAEPDVWAEDLKADRDIVLVSRLTLVWWVLSLLIPFLIGGWTGFMWGGLIRIFLIHHVTWSVNSVCHLFGSRPFRTKDRSTNFWPVGLLAFGEGGHNTHHASPKSARHGLRWWHFDTSWLIIRVMEDLRLVHDVYVQETTALRRSLKERAAGVRVVLRRELQRRTSHPQQA